MLLSNKKQNVLGKKIAIFILILIVGIVLGTIAMTLVYMLPTERMDKNVRSSIDIMYTELVYPQQVMGYKSSQLDNETDSVMLLSAIFDDTKSSPLEQAMKVERVVYPSTQIAGTTGSLVAYAWENQLPTDTVEYSRYWHGYMLWLKPLLLLLDYADIRMLNMMLQLFLLIVLIKKFIDKGMKEYLLPFSMALIVVNPVATAMSMQFSSIYYLVLISMLMILTYHEKWRSRQWYPYVFFILGMGTAFFDFLTYPMAALCMPLLLLLAMNEKEWKEKIVETIILGICFGTGYVGMWAGKWLVCSVVVMDTNVLTKVIKQFTLHTGTTQDARGIIYKLEAIWKNVSVLLKWPYLIFFASVIMFYLRSVNWKNIGKNIQDSIPFLCVGLVPVAWIFFTSSHAYVCYWYTYRGMMSSVFAAFCILYKLSFKKKSK